MFWRRPILWSAVISSLFFGLAHSLFWQAGKIEFELGSFLVIFGIGGLLATIRLLTGSIFPAMAGHTCINFFHHFIRMR